MGVSQMIDVEPDLMRGVAGAHRTAAWLGHVADQQPGQPSACAASAKPLDEGDQLRVAPVTVARQPHRLPGRTVDRQGRAAGETALGIAADDGGPQPVPGSLTRTEQLLGRRLRGANRGEPPKSRQKNNSSADTAQLARRMISLATSAAAPGEDAHPCSPAGDSRAEPAHS